MFDVAERLKDVAYKMGLIKDYVVEYGESGDWSWTKWYSGKIQVKCRLTTDYAFSLSYGYNTYNNWTLTVPADVPILDGTIHDIKINRQTGASGLVTFSSYQIDDRSFKYFGMNGTNAPATITLSVLYEFKARWRELGG